MLLGRRLAAMTELLKSVDYEVFGTVQGVCFRMYTEGEAKKRGLVGWVKNTSKGTVTGQVQGPEEKVDAMSLEDGSVGKMATTQTKLNIVLREDPAIPLLGIYPEDVPTDTGNREVKINKTLHLTSGGSTSGKGVRCSVLFVILGCMLLLAFATGQERRNKPESSAAKALLLTSSGAREEEHGRERQRGREEERERETQRDAERAEEKTKRKRRREEVPEPRPF